MTHDDDVDPPRQPDLSEPARNLTPEEMEAVVGRAVELQAGGAGPGGEGVSEVEMVRIGQELGLDPATVRRAMVEVRSRPDDGNALLRAMGARFAWTQRVVPQPPDHAAAQVEDYLRATEFMVPERRFPDGTRYVRDFSFAALIARITRPFSRSRPPLGPERVDVTVAAVDAGSTLVEAAADLRDTRLGLTIAALVTGAVGAIIVFATNPITSPWMLLGLLLLVGPWYFFRAIYGTVHRKTREKVESLLDRIVHDELH